jgi:hypothetical protein
MAANSNAPLHGKEEAERARRLVNEIEPFDWTPEVELVKGLSPRLGAVLAYAQAVSERSTARRKMFVGAVLEDSSLGTDDLIRHLHDDERMSALFETALDAAARSTYETKLLLLARVVAQAIDDAASIDDSVLMATTIRELEPPHVRAFAILAKSPTYLTGSDRIRAIEAKRDDEDAVYPTASSWLLRYEMDVSDDIADALSGMVERQALIINDAPASCSWTVTEYGRRILDHLRAVDLKLDHRKP